MSACLHAGWEIDGGQLQNKTVCQQGIIDPTGTETQQFFSLMFVMAKKYRVVRPYLKWNSC